MSDELAWETLDSRVAYTCEGFDVVTDAVRFPDGAETEYDYLAEGESVVILPFAAAGQRDVVVIEEWRQAVGRVNLGLPAGGVEPGDDRLSAAVARELEEETGYRPGSIDHMTTVEPANGFADAVFHYFLARECEPSGEQDLDDDEDIRVGTRPLDDLLAAARDDELRDGRSMLGVIYYALFEREARSRNVD
jgi:ADP-ribose pyrophosphatase